MGGRYKYTIEQYYQEALKYQTRTTFKDGSPNIYKSAQSRGILDQICNHMLVLRKKWTIEGATKEAHKYNSRRELIENNYSAYRFLCRRKLIDDIFPKPKPWTAEIVQKYALKYKYRIDFMNNDPNAYAAARRMGIIQQVCKHMPKKPNRENVYTHKDLESCAKKYKTRSEFSKKSNNLYARARHRGVLDQICEHMPIVSNNSLMEKYLMDFVRQFYPSSKKLVLKKLKIENKPHISGFELDIYIPELKKGIEFDGTYYHSIAGLKRGRPHWPECDLKQYHKIKDDCFLSKGIEVLHIKEKDWEENQDKCLSDIVDFLKIEDLIKEEVVENIKIDKHKDSVFYDFSVADNNNFFADGMLVHNCIDEIDVIQDPRALKEAKMIPSIYKQYFPLTIYLSTRKFAGGLMEKTLKEVQNAGGEILKWNILDVCERITKEEAKVDEPRKIRYVSRDLPMETITEDVWKKMPLESQIKFERIEAYAGIADHPMLPVMRNYLVDRPQTDVKHLYKPLVAVHNNFKTTDSDMAEAQLLCNKPSATGLVYPRFDNEKNILSVNQAMKKLLGPDCTIDSFEYLKEYIKNLGITVIGGGDWGYTDYTSLVVIALMPGGEAWLLTTFLEQHLELYDIVKYGRELQEDWNVDKWYVDQNYPSYLKTLRRSPKSAENPGAGWKIPTFKKEVSTGITNLQGKILDSTGIRRFYIIDTPENKPVIDAFGEYRWALDGKGEPKEGVPYHDSDGISDIMDSIRYPAQNKFGKGTKPVATATGHETNQQQLQNKLNKSTPQQAANTLNNQIMKDKVSELATKGTAVKKKGKIFWG